MIELLQTIANGNTDLWRETEVACEILLEGGYEGHQEDMEYIRDVSSGNELEQLLSRGEWHFQQTEKWMELV
ncbi:MAG TPA: hypothetical protein PKI14_18835 [Fervidobacterium sp.]|nr:hypothetical protein [Fervidobacterium sp.]